MDTFEQELASLEQILEQEILPGIEPPYEDQAKLSQVALRMKKSAAYKKLDFNDHHTKKDTLLFSLLYLREAKPLKENLFKDVGFLVPLTRYFRTKDEQKYVASRSIQLIFDPEKEFNRMRRFVEILHGPTQGIMAGQPKLKYISPIEEIYILPERETEITAGYEKYPEPQFRENMSILLYTDLPKVTDFFKF